MNSDIFPFECAIGVSNALTPLPVGRTSIEQKIAEQRQKSWGFQTRKSLKSLVTGDLRRIAAISFVSFSRIRHRHHLHRRGTRHGHPRRTRRLSRRRPPHGTEPCELHRLHRPLPPLHGCGQPPRLRPPALSLAEDSAGMNCLQMSCSAIP